MASKSIDQNVTEILISAGELSGDTLAAEILSELQKIKPKSSKAVNYHFFGNTGPALRAANVEKIHDIEELSVVGLLEIAKEYRRLSKILDNLVELCIARKVKLAILIDFPGFHLKLGRKLKAHGIPTVLVSSPQIWGWRYKRIEKIRQSIQTVLCFYPFEEDIYLREGVNGQYVGHPLIPKILKARKEFPVKKEKNLIALLPGSRKSEILRLMPAMLDTVNVLQEQGKNWKYEIAVAHDGARRILQQFELPPKVILSKRPTYALLSRANSALACSGTVTLECAYFQTPFLLMYSANALTAWLARKIMTIPYLGIVNAVLGRFATAEFLQEEIIAEHMASELIRLQESKNRRASMLADFQLVEKKMGSGKAATLAARAIHSLL